MCPGSVSLGKSLKYLLFSHLIPDLMNVENMNNVKSSSVDCSPQSLRMEGRCWLIMLRLLLECLKASLHEPAREIKKTRAKPVIYSISRWGSAFNHMMNAG